MGKGQVLLEMETKGPEAAAESKNLDSYKHLNDGE